MPDPADAQPASLALQVALTELWRSRGVAPGAVVGHSFGEVAAAWAAGALTLEQALRARRTPLAAGADARAGAAGCWPSAVASSRSVAPAPRRLGRRGQRPALGHARGRPRRGRRRSTARACQRLDRLPQRPGSTGLRARSSPRPATSAPAPPRIPLYSTVAGAHVTDADYWWRNLREPTRFDPALSADGARRLDGVRGARPASRPGRARARRPSRARSSPPACAAGARRRRSSPRRSAKLRAAGREPVALADALRVAEHGPAEDRPLSRGGVAAPYSQRATRGRVAGHVRVRVREAVERA